MMILAVYDIAAKITLWNYKQLNSDLELLGIRPY